MYSAVVGDSVLVCVCLPFYAYAQMYMNACMHIYACPYTCALTYTQRNACVYVQTPVSVHMCHYYAYIHTSMRRITHMLYNWFLRG